MSHHKNITSIKAVFNGLNELQSRVVFVGGATVSLYADRETIEVRPTEDVDVIIEVLSYKNETELEEQLRKIGFKNDIFSKVRCRFLYQGITVDIMPISGDWVGFNNIWYPEGYKNAIDYSIDEKRTVRIFSAIYFLATKLEAFKSRGNNNGIQSDDFEDIVFVLENRRSIWEELKNASGEIKGYLQKEFGALLKKPDFLEWVSCHVDQLSSPPAYYFIVSNLKEFVSAK